MMKLLITALMLLPAASFAQELTGAELGEGPAKKEAAAEGTVRRPDPQGIMSELSSSLKLSSKQEDRISSALKKQVSEFDKLLKEYEKCSAEEKKWRFKANEARYRMLKINREIPDTVREYLDDEQRESYAELLDAAKAPASPSAKGAAPAAAKPAKKRKLVKRKKAPAAPVEEDGGVIVDEEPAPKAPARKGSLKKKTAPASELPPGEVGYPPGSRNNPAAAALAEEDDADLGSYP